jgi:putative transposase
VYDEAKAGQADPSLLPARSRRDAQLAEEIRRVRRSYLWFYSARQVCRQLNRENIAIARCTIDRLMRALGCQSWCAAGAVAQRLAIRLHRGWWIW